MAPLDGSSQVKQEKTVSDQAVNAPEVLTKSSVLVKGQPETKVQSPKLRPNMYAGPTNHSLDGNCPEGSHIVPSPVTPFIVSNRQLGHESEQVREISTGDDGPNIIVQPATPGSSTKTGLGDPFNKPIETSKSTGVKENGKSQVKLRKQQRPPSPTPDRYVFLYILRFVLSFPKSCLAEVDADFDRDDL